MTRSHFGSIQYIRPGRYRIWWTRHGKRMSDYVDGDRDDAERALALKAVEDIPSKVTWGQFYEAKVVPTYEGLAEKTVDDYSRTWRVELEPRIADEKVADMDWVRANEVLTSVSAPTVQRRSGALLKKMCNIAVRSGILRFNPVQAIAYSPHRPKRKELYDCTEVASLMDAVDGIKYEAAILLMLGCGMRPEEALALTWEDVRPHEANGSVYCVARVDKALTQANCGKVLKDTKNTSSDRDAVCGEPFASRVLELADGSSGPLVPSGRPYRANKPEDWYTSPITVTHNWRKWCERNGVRYVTPENMRSSYSTMMGEAGAPDSVVSGNMGHSDGTTKGKHYQRVTLRAKCMAADLLAELIEDVS